MGTGALNKNLRSPHVCLSDNPKIDFNDCSIAVGLNKESMNMHDKDGKSDCYDNLEKLTEMKSRSESEGRDILESINGQSSTATTTSKISNDSIEENKLFTQNNGAKDIKLEVSSILDHSSGAALYEKLMTSDENCFLDNDYKDAEAEVEAEVEEDLDGEEGWHNYIPDSATLLQQDEDEETWRNRDPDDDENLLIRTKNPSSGSATTTSAVSTPIPVSSNYTSNSPFFSPSVLKSISSSLFPSVADTSTVTSTASIVSNANDSKSKSSLEVTSATATSTSSSSMDDIKELRAARYRLKQDQEKQNSTT